MKKIVFSIVGSMLMSLCAVQAQQTDTERAAAKSKSKQDKYKTEQSRQGQTDNRSQDQKWQQESDRAQGHDAYASEGMVVVEKSELPASLKQKLQNKKYAGWENATIYHNANTGEYVIAPRAYRFDSKGNEVEMGDASQGYSSRDRSSGQQNNNQSGQRSNQGGQYRSGDTQQSTTQQQGQDRTGETPASTSEQSDNNQQSGQNRTGDQSSATGQTPTGDQSSQSTQRTSDDQATRDQQQSKSYRSTETNQSDAQGQPGNQYRTEDMVEVQTEQIPASLRRTLRESQYGGWEEKGTLYQDPSTSEYVLVMDKSGNSTQPRAYRFDKNGQLKEGDEGTTQNKQ